MAAVTPGAGSGCGAGVRGVLVHAARISAAFSATRASKSLKIPLECAGVGGVAVRLQAIENRHPRIARRVLVLRGNASQRGQQRRRRSSRRARARPARAWP